VTESSTAILGDIRNARVRRLWQIMRVAHTTLFIMLLVNIPQQDFPVLISLAVASLALSFAYIPLRGEDPDRTAEIIMGVIGVCLLVLMWTGSGIRSSAMFAYPGLLMFCAIIGNRRLFRISYVIMALYMTLLVFATKQGWRTGSEHPTSWYTLLEFLVVMSAVTFVVNLLAGDLFALLARLDGEVKLAKESQNRIQHVADHDNLTGLPNRRLGDLRFQQALDASLAAGSKLGVVFIDVDNFKNLNDTHGHLAGDRVLQHLGAVISGVLRKTDTLIRQGGDEFLLLLPHVGDEYEVIQVLEKMITVAHQPLQLGDITYIPSCSIGAVMAPDHGAVLSELLRKADTAMYRAKAAGRNRFALFTDDNLPVSSLS
jgi:diguanylate cyclase